MCRIYQISETQGNNKVTTSEIGLNCAPPSPSAFLEQPPSITVTGLKGQPSTILLWVVQAGKTQKCQGSVCLTLDLARSHLDCS